MPTMTNIKRDGRRRQRGAAAVEFALIAIMFFTLLLGIIEFGRFFYLWNTVQEVTRRAARDAVVQDFSSAQIDVIQRNAIFQSGSSGTANLFFSPEISNLNISLQYLNASGALASPMPSSPADNLAACLDASRTSSCITYVEAKICVQEGNTCNPVKYVPLIGLFSFLSIDIPVSTVTMPAESLGFSI